MPDLNRKGFADNTGDGLGDGYVSGNSSDGYGSFGDGANIGSGLDGFSDKSEWEGVLC